MEESLNEAIIATQQSCSFLHEQIKKYQTALLELNLRPEVSSSPPKDIVQLKLVKIHSELSVLQAKTAHPPLHHPLAVSSVLNEQLQEVVEQNEKIEKVLKVRISSLNERLEELENLILEQVKLQNAMEKRLLEHPSPSFSEIEDHFLSSYNDELSANKGRCDLMRRDLKKKMRAFLSRVFPSPGSSSSSILEKVIPLHHLVDDLITQSVTKPENPYLTLGSQHWPPFIELLLSYGMAVRHPADIHRIKLRDLHL